MQSYWSHTTDLLEPVAMAEFSNTLASCIVGADDAHLKTLDKSKKGGSFRGHLWCVVGTDGANAGGAHERRRRSLPIVDSFDAWVDTIHPKLLPRSPLRIATTYATNQREFIRRCFEDGRFEIDNGVSSAEFACSP